MEERQYDRAKKGIKRGHLLAGVFLGLLVIALNRWQQAAATWPESSEARGATMAAPAEQTTPSKAAHFPGTRGGTRTPNLRFRRPTLYPVELRAHVLNSKL
jgi:hypothetical protein